MNDVILALVSIAVGLVFVFAGAGMLRFVIAVWGAFMGFTFGAAVMAEVTGDGFLGTSATWFAGFVMALVFGVLAYLFYALGVVLAMAGVGFSLGAAALGALGLDWDWLVVGGAMAAGLLLGLLAVAADLPHVLLIVLSSFAGSSVAVFGVMLLTGPYDSESLLDEQTTATMADDWWWWVLYVALAVVGIVVQAQRRPRAVPAA